LGRGEPDSLRHGQDARHASREEEGCSMFERPSRLGILVFLAFFTVVLARAQDGAAPREGPRGRRIVRLIASLDAEDFARREQAMSELLAMGRDIVPRLEQAARARPSPEQLSRLAAIIERLRPS